jgi:hypothetical protein
LKGACDVVSRAKASPQRPARFRLDILARFATVRQKSIVWHASLTPKPEIAGATNAKRAPRLPDGAAVALRSIFTTTAIHAPTVRVSPICANDVDNLAALTTTTTKHHTVSHLSTEVP